MLAVERMKVIRQSLAQEDCVSVSALSARLSVSEETIRRDLEKLSRSDATIMRVHGGAYKVGVFDREMPIRLRETLSVDQKKQIAQYAYRLIRINDTIMVDCSTTALYLARLIKQSGTSLTVITNSLRVIEEFEDCDFIKLVCVGGTFRKNTQSFIGYTATKTLAEYHADKCFVSCTGLNLEHGVTDNSENEAEVRSLMLQRSREKYLLVDRRKLGRSFMKNIVNLDGLDAVIIENEPEPEWVDHFEKNGVRLICS